MSRPKYILCNWKSRMWPAKVLAKNIGSIKKSVLQTQSDSLDVEILGLDRQLSVKCTNSFPLEKTKIEKLVGQLRERPTQSTEEISYRKALKLALEILDNHSKHIRCSLSSSDRDAAATAAQKNRKERHSPPSTLNGSPAGPRKRSVGEGASSDLRRGSPRLSSSCTKAQSKLKEHTPIKAEHNERSRRSSGSSVGDSPKTPKSRTSLLRGKKDAVVRTGQNSLGDCTKFKPQRKRLRSSLEQHCLSTSGVPSAILENAPVSAFRHSTPSTPTRKMSCASNHKLQKHGVFSANSAPSGEMDKHTWKENQVLVEVQRSSSLDNVRCDPRESLIASSPDMEMARCQSCPDPFASPKSEPDSPVPSSRTSHRSMTPASCKATRIKLPDFDVEEKVVNSDLSVEFSSPDYQSQNSTWVDEVTEEDDDEELPNILLQQEPCSIESGMLVWCKYYKYPYWPGVVNYVRRKIKKASVMFVEESLADPTKKTKKGVSVALRALKHFDCEEKQVLTEKARQEYGRAIDWCIALIADYRIRLGCSSFSGSFMEYCAAEISYPVRKEIQRGPFHLTFPTLETDTEDSQVELTPTRSHLAKKCLPDRTRAARDKANEKLVEYIVKEKRADKHLLSVLKGEKKSRWLYEFLHPSRYLTCVETYLEDEEQLELVVDYLHTICDKMTSKVETLINGDMIRFILDVLLPEAVIYAISALDRIDYKKAEEKYMKGPSVSKREREIFEEQILEKKLRELQDTAIGGGKS
ncbi:PWWP domain-containing DNA repair factor 3A isoform X2 [Ambystoma mexicanum]|uniref:PWWP domain-containing DNA repair factor 3A isoform X2 n=1 Tax=Ambystoma mexicanum TaxID=8296 RepID=UPI0037E86222